MGAALGQPWAVFSGRLTTNFTCRSSSTRELKVKYILYNYWSHFEWPMKFLMSLPLNTAQGSHSAVFQFCVISKKKWFDYLRLSTYYLFFFDITRTTSWVDGLVRGWLVALASFVTSKNIWADEIHEYVQCCAVVCRYLQCMSFGMESTGS